MAAGIAVGERSPSDTPFKKLKRFLQGKRKPEPPSDVIPPMASIYGPGPSFVNDTERAAITDVGDPYAPHIGAAQPTHQEVIEEGRFGNPRQSPSHPEKYWNQRDTDRRQRYAVEYVDGNGWPTPVDPQAGHVPAVRPLSNRWTATARPDLNSYTNTSATGMQPYTFNGEHFSMADHRRDYDIMTMQPVKSARNTYRLPPTAWDLDIIDEPAEVGPPVEAVYEVPTTGYGEVFGGFRSYRLGG